MEPIRINKYLSESGYCSRREADKLITLRKVKINGKPAKLGDKVGPKDRVEVDHKILKPLEEKIYIAFNKPFGVITTTDPNCDNNILEYIKTPQRVFPIGRLDVESTGLILLTNDGDIVNKISKAKYHHEKEYMVTVDKPLTPGALKELADGVLILENVRTLPAKVEKISPNQMKMTIVQGLNRQVRRMCEAVGYEVKILTRTRIMNISLGELGRGKWRHLSSIEMKNLFALLEESDKKAEQPTSPTPRLKIAPSAKKTAPRKPSNFKKPLNKSFSYNRTWSSKDSGKN